MNPWHLVMTLSLNISFYSDLEQYSLKCNPRTSRDPQYALRDLQNQNYLPVIEDICKNLKLLFFYCFY